MSDTKFEFTIGSGERTVTVSGDESLLQLSQPDNDPDRQPGDDDVIVTDMQTARELHRRLGEIIASFPGKTPS